MSKLNRSSTPYDWFVCGAVVLIIALIAGLVLVGDLTRGPDVCPYNTMACVH